MGKELLWYRYLVDNFAQRYIEEIMIKTKNRLITPFTNAHRPADAQSPSMKARRRVLLNR
jgi:hypothetical protein